MKLKIALMTATAIGLSTGVALAGDNNKTYSVQTGSDNVLSVDQDGSNNVAGSRTNFNEYLKQAGNKNLMEINQTGNSNGVARTWASDSGAFQTGNLNKLTLSQTSFGYNQHGNGHIIEHIRQNSSNAATGNTGDTNTANIVQRGTADTITGQGPSAGHWINVIVQTHTTGAANSLDIEQAGAFSAWYGGGQNNRIDTVRQNGAGNTATISQNGTGPVLSTSGQQQRGPANVIQRVEQIGVGHDATVTQNGHQNYVEKVEQTSSDNSAIISLTGDGNGATRNGGYPGGHPSVGLLFGAAGVAGAAASSVVQGGGSGNQVQYTVSGGNDNQFGFYQLGDDNQATGISITGDDNHLGVYQSGNDNKLVLAEIGGNDNVVGLKQIGNDNTANLTINGDRNGGYNSFTSPIIPLGLTAGLLEQSGGNFNNVTLTVSGSDNVFATKQIGSNNTITGTQDQSGLLGNQVAVVQLGNSNTATFTQTGSGNAASISQ